MMKLLRLCKFSYGLRKQLQVILTELNVSGGGQLFVDRIRKGSRHNGAR